MTTDLMAAQSPICDQLPQSDSSQQLNAQVIDRNGRTDLLAEVGYFAVTYLKTLSPILYVRGNKIVPFQIIICSYPIIIFINRGNVDNVE